MYAVGKLGSYISRSVYIASGPFHPFGGAVDIIVVEQPDGSFKSSPWNVRFGKFQGFLQASEKLVSVGVNGVEADFRMYLDHKGEAYFLREIDVEVPDVLLSPSSVEDSDGGSHIRSPMKSTCCNDEAHVAGPPGKTDAGVEKCRISRPVSKMEDGFSEKKNGSSVVRTKSMECAEIAADLLEVKWCTNLVSSTRKKNGVLRLSSLEGKDVNESLCIQKFVERNDYSILPQVANSPECARDPSDSAENGISRTYPQVSTLQPLLNSVEDAVSGSILTISDFRNPTSEPLVEKNISYGGKRCDTELVLDHDSPSSVLAGDTVRSDIQNSGNSDVELIFGDLDDSRENETRQMQDPILKGHEKDTLGSQIKTDADEVFMPNLVYSSSAEMSGQKDLPVSDKNLGIKLRTVSSEINISGGSHSEEVRAARSLPNMWISDSDICESGNVMKHVLHSESFPLEYTFLVNDYLNNVEPKVYNDHQPSKSPQLTQDSMANQELKTESGSPIVGNSSRPVDASNGNWRFLPFSFRGSRSMEVSESALSFNRSSGAKNAIEDERDTPKVKVTKMKVRESTPSSAQLASLNLKEGRNTVTFTFSTPMLGKQKVDAQIHLWKWDTRIVISDVDGTITRSDLLGQVMPWVGVDWLQTGVANLFSAIKENGYQVLFLSARAISQSYGTRQFIFNLKQDGKALPEGPVVISPDGIIPSLYREVVRRTPHEFKISCLEAIKALFPKDRNPFYAGFGNRDTDEISYLKVGIPKGKIFMINPKGEIAVNHRVDRKSYTSFHALVNDMFPLMSSSEQEDYNSWNYWKLPLPPIEI